MEHRSRICPAGHPDLNLSLPLRRGKNLPTRGVPHRKAVSGAGRAHLATFFSQPRSYISGMLCSLRLAGLDLGQAIWNFLYFTEALLVGQWMRGHGLNHAHIHYASTVGLLMAKTFPITISITMHGPAEFENPENFS